MSSFFRVGTTPSKPVKGSTASSITVVESPDSPNDSSIDEEGLTEGARLAKVSLLDEEDARFMDSFSQESRDRAVRKVDVRLIPMLAALYLLSYIDRANLANAKIEGMLKTLHMVKNEYNVALSIFFFPYILLEVPANAIMSKYFRNRASVWLGSLTVAWGIAMTCHGFVRNYHELLFFRFLIGIPEAGFFPGAILILNQWYLKRELHQRIAIFYTASAAAGAFSGLFAFFLVKLGGLWDIEGWRWIFIVEGGITLVLGVIAFFCLIDTPSSSGKWLDPDEIKYLELRMIEQDGYAVEEHHFSWKIVKSVICDWQLYLHSLVYWSQSAPNYGLKFTIPTIIMSMGFSSGAAQLLSIGPYFFGAIASWIGGKFSDKYGRRFPFVFGPQLLVFAAFSTIFPLAANISSHVVVAYTSICVACVGLYQIGPGASSWVSNNLAPTNRKAVSLAYFISIGNLGGIIGSWMFVESEAPKYPTGFSLCLAFVALGLFASSMLELLYVFINKRRAAMTEDEIKWKYTEKELEEMGHDSPRFRFTL